MVHFIPTMESFSSSLKLSAERLARNNTSFFVADVKLTCEDIPIGVSILKHLNLDSQTTLESSSPLLFETVYTYVDNAYTTSFSEAFDLLMISWLHLVYSSKQVSCPDSKQPCVDYILIDRWYLLKLAFENHIVRSISSCERGAFICMFNNVNAVLTSRIWFFQEEIDFRMYNVSMWLESANIFI